VSAPPPVLVVMGVSGAGKSTVGRMAADRLAWVFKEGDDLHPAANVAKMRSGRPLNDDDRGPWLAAVAAWIDDQAQAARPAVIACSALKRRYRRVLTDGRPFVRIVYVEGPSELIRERLEARRGHYFPPALLASQFADLEPPTAEEDPIVVEAAWPIETQVDKIAAMFGG
jgi:carbohydrate kinase (thermoresistant glucokinase family)